jgi:hypothetical protein
MNIVQVDIDTRTPTPRGSHQMIFYIGGVKSFVDIDFDTIRTVFRRDDLKQCENINNQLFAGIDEQLIRNGKDALTESDKEHIRDNMRPYYMQIIEEVVSNRIYL